MSSPASSPPPRGIAARIARIGVDSSQRLGRHRWVVERTLGWLLSYKRLALRYDHTAMTITALARLAITLICARRATDELMQRLLRPGRPPLNRPGESGD